MLSTTDFSKKQMMFVFSGRGDKVSFRNDNIVVTDLSGKIKMQASCYRVFMLCIIGNTSITSGLIMRTNKYGITVCMMTENLKLYALIGSKMEGNTLLRKKQYSLNTKDIACFIVKNKIIQQRDSLKSLRKKTPLCKDVIKKLEKYIIFLDENELTEESLLGIEGTVARMYFSVMFDNAEWKGRKPRAKTDYLNATLDIGYNLLFNLVDALLQVYGFDTFCGVYHKEFYRRKSLSCDIMEPMRPMIDLAVRKAINLGQCKESDFKVIQGQYRLEYNKSADYINFLMAPIMENKDSIFLFVQQYYRSFMKGKPVEMYLLFG